uniref:Uncharacterized protein n=1 Tax=Strigamia maritima TaxID=126957 RepID=T1J341_STRMM
MEGNKMSTLKRIFGKATKRLSNSPQRDAKHSSHKNLETRTVNTIASEVKDSSSEWNSSVIKDEWKCESECGSNISPTLTAPFVTEETPSKSGLFPEDPVLEMTTEGEDQDAAMAKDAPETVTFIVDKELGADEHKQHLWSNLSGPGNPLNDSMQESAVTSSTVSDSVVSEDGDGMKIARSEGTEPQVGFPSRVRHRGDGSASRKDDEKRRGHHRRHHRDEKSPDESSKPTSGKKRAVVYMSRDDLKRTATLPTLQRASTMCSNSLVKDGAPTISAGSVNGANRQSPSESHLNSRNESASIRTARSVIVSNRTETSSPSGKMVSSSSTEEETMSESGTWSVNSEKKTGNFSSSSLVIVESNIKKKLSVSDVQRMFEEFTKMQQDMRVLVGNNENMWHRYEDDVAQLREEIDAVYVEMLLTSGSVKTGRSSLTLHSGEAAEVAIAEQLQQMEEDGPLVPYEGNQLVPLNSRAHSLFINKVKKQEDEGSFIRRGLMRAVLEVSSKARRLWSMYTRMYPAL